MKDCASGSSPGHNVAKTSEEGKGGTRAGAKGDEAAPNDTTDMSEN